MYNDSLVDIEQYTVGPRASKTARKRRKCCSSFCKYINLFQHRALTLPRCDVTNVHTF